MSRSGDTDRAADAELARWERLDQTCRQILVVTKLRRERLPMDVIAQRLGWSERTLYRWLRALELIERRAVKMTERST